MAAPTPYVLVSRASATLAEARRILKSHTEHGPQTAQALVQVAEGYTGLAALAAALDPEPAAGDTVEDDADQ